MNPQWHSTCTGHLQRMTNGLTNGGPKKSHSSCLFNCRSSVCYKTLSQEQSMTMLLDLKVLLLFCWWTKQIKWVSEVLWIQKRWGQASDIFSEILFYQIEFREREREGERLVGVPVGLPVIGPLVDRNTPGWWCRCFSAFINHVYISKWILPDLYVGLIPCHSWNTIVNFSAWWCNEEGCFHGDCPFEL